MKPPTGPLLALDTSTGVGSVAVGDGERILAEVVLNVGPGHSSVLLPAIDQAVRWAGLTPADLAGVVVGGGPGSFTGLRIAAATAKGLVHALRIPMWAYSGLLATAASAGAAGQPVCTLFDARRRDVYAACYRVAHAAPHVQTLMEPAALSLDDLLRQFGDGALPLFTGEAALLHRSELETAGGTVLPAHLAFPRAAALLWLARSTPAEGVVERPAAWEPGYIRASGAERIAAARIATAAP